MDSDPDIEIIEKDSGMSSWGGSKDDTPERRTAMSEDTEEVRCTNEIETNNENYDEPDETFFERIWGLTEMFPDPVRNVAATISELTVSCGKSLFHFSCNASWIFFTSSMILFAPVIFETERAQMEEMQRSQQKKVLLGPGSAMQSGGAPGMPAMPPMASR